MEFGCVDAVRKHMIDKCHCKIAYQSDEDRAELAEFYDFGGGSDWEDLEDEDMEDEDMEVCGSEAYQLTQKVDNTLSCGRWTLSRSALWPSSWPPVPEGLLLPASSFLGSERG